MNIIQLLLLLGIIVLNIIIIIQLKKCCDKEKYEPPITLSLPEWNNYVASGMNTLLGSGGVIPGGTENLGWSGGGAVYKGRVRQGNWDIR